MNSAKKTMVEIDEMLTRHEAKTFIVMTLVIIGMLCALPAIESIGRIHVRACPYCRRASREQNDQKRPMRQLGIYAPLFIGNEEKSVCLKTPSMTRAVS